MLLTSTSFFAQTIRKYSNEFLNIGVDAAALGMSNAVTAQTSDVNSGYWNPAGILQLEDKQMALMHANYFANIAQNKLANAGRDTEFYNGKIASAKFFVRSVLPHISIERAVVESETGEIMNIAEAAF